MGIGGVGAEMPRYKCHKIVHALKIKSLEAIEEPTSENTVRISEYILTPEDDRFAAFNVTADFVSRTGAIADDDQGYLVVYKDGYRSWSPTKAFEDGYTRI